MCIFCFWNISQVSVDNVGTIKQIIEKDGKFNADYTGIAGGTMVTFNESSNLNFYYSKYYGGNYTPKKEILYTFVTVLTGIKKYMVACLKKLHISV